MKTFRTATGAAIVGVVLACHTSPGMAQSPTVADLQRKIQQRDQVILELLERVEALERRVGLSSAISAADSGGGDAPRSRVASIDGVDPSATERPHTAASATASESGRVVAEEMDVQRALERSLSESGALLLEPGAIEVEPSLSFARDEDATPTLVTVAPGTTAAGQIETNANELTADIALRAGLPHELQFELGLPVRYRHVETVTEVGFTPMSTTDDDGVGVGDLRVGLAKTLLREGVGRPDLIGRVTWDTDIGPKSDNGVALGGGFHELTGSVTAIKRHDPVALVGHLGYQHVFESDGLQPGPAILGGASAVLALNPELSMRLGLSGSYRDAIEVAGTEIDGSERMIGTLSIGGSMLISRHTLLDLEAGIGLTDDADDFSVTVSMPIRFYTGAF